MTILASLLNFGRLTTLAVFAYTFCANAFFLVRRAEGFHGMLLTPSYDHLNTFCCPTRRT